MKEDFLNYIWQHQYFNKIDLKTLEGESLTVLKTGMPNANAGPDFLGATLKIGSVTWNGSVEMHVKASDWHRHQHQTDERYDQVILHVVWEADKAIARTDNSAIATLELQHLVQPDLLTSYLALKQDTPTFPCQPFLQMVPELPKMLMLDRVLLERLDQKQEFISQLLELNKGDWEETTYQALLANFGFKINQEPFLRLSKVLPYSILRKQTNLLSEEALLFGQAGFLDQISPEEEYLSKLKQEFTYLKRKYKLPAGLKASDWNFLRLRPANFPTVRLAQAAGFFSAREKLFTSLLTLDSLKEYLSFLDGFPSTYWQTHYMPGRESKGINKGFGPASRILILINTVIPLLFAYARQQDNQALIDKAIKLLESLPAEKNHITALYYTEGIRNKSAADSQGILQLYKYYCQPIKCLSCSIGHYILKSNLVINGAA